MVGIPRGDEGTREPWRRTLKTRMTSGFVQAGREEVGRSMRSCGLPLLGRFSGMPEVLEG